MWQAGQEFCLQVRAGTIIGQLQPGHSFTVGWGDTTRSLLQRPAQTSEPEQLVKTFRTSVAHRLLVQLTLNPRNERQVSVTSKFYLSMNSAEQERAQAGYLSPQQPLAVKEGRFSPPLL